jgi:N-acetylmuramoyl-L-alanine amidase
LRSVTFDDSDGRAKLVLDIAREVSELRVTPANNNRIFFVDLLRAGDPVSAAPLPPVDVPATAGKADVPAGNRRLRVIVIDPGHGGMDPGVRSETVSEKDLTLALARRLRSALQSRLGATVLLTRDSDVALDNEARSAVANNNQANLFISLHIGRSPSTTESASSLFIMKEGFGDLPAATAGRDQLFLPWYLGYKVHRQRSAAAAGLLQQELVKGIPGWNFPVRSAPLALLSSAAMPSVLLEIGNVNNPVTAQTLLDAGFQTRLVNAMVDAIQRFSESMPAAAN